MKKKIIRIEVSARHVHLTGAHIEKLFGKGYKLKKYKSLSQTGEFAAKEKLVIKNKKIELRTRIIGPARIYSQVEISRSDAFKLGINPPVRMSGDHKKSASLLLIGPKGRIKLSKGVIIAQRHIHVNKEEAKKYKLRNSQKVNVEVEGDRSLIFKNVKVKVNDNYKLDMHIDVDEANASGINLQNSKGYII